VGVPAGKDADEDEEKQVWGNSFWRAVGRVEGRLLRRHKEEAR